MLFSHYRRAEGALVVFDVTKEKTFENVSRWIEELRVQAEPDAIVVLVGNKIDLCEKNSSLRRVTKEEAKLLAQNYNALYEETSAVTAQNVTEVFEKLLRGLIID